ncbi:type II secretion system major pseudopilin GspG [Zavarzinia aquatilis]|uniref:Type II secretion system core protein G n=1 Tax=Zavarzinia aquatilis TaxID=2211142 RepID=A0A317EJD0_9PROT|nr:type II secretion system major pseudopilin GspG [Zavarzinia aquatilis]PWR25355.1 type II secretion system protein GspG [Zavarzinia aquatilis]
MTTEKRYRVATGEDGYTLIELLVVLAILGLLVAIAVPRVVGYLEGSKVKTAEIQLAQIDAALDLYRLDLGDFPGEAQGLKALIEKPDGARVWNGPYLNRADGIIDPWSRPYLYKRAAGAKDYRLYSLGADGAEGGEGEAADIVAKGLK